MELWVRSETNEDELLQWPDCHASHRDWIVWLATGLVTFGVLETRGVLGKGPTLTHIVRQHVRTNSRRKALTAASLIGASMWLTYHFIFEGVDS